MNTAVLFVGFLLTFSTVLCLTPLVARYARHKKWVDLPGGDRTIHKRPTPRAGGIAIIVTFLLGVIYFFFIERGLGFQIAVTTHLSSWAFFVGSGVIALMGLYDDAYGLGFKKKFLFQLFVAYGMYLAGFRVEVPAIWPIENDPYLQAAFSLPLTILWYLGIMNAVNLVDGLDGLASGISLIAFAGFAFIFAYKGDVMLLPLAVIMIGALFGFLVYNFNPASIFLGDTGSLFLGFVLGTYALQGPIHTNPMIALIIMGLVVGYPLMDTILAFVRRFVKGKSPFAPDKDHIHHRINKKLRISTRGTVVSLYCLQGLFCMAAITLVIAPMQYLILVLLFIGAGTGLILKRLGYLNIKQGIKLMRIRTSELMSNRIPRGNWSRSGDGAVPAVLEPVVSPANNLQTENEDRELVSHSLE